jgi:asparagine synthase (glutamine-hydrolysing)
MCGIFGSFNKYQLADYDKKLNLVLKALHHRGPDDHGVEKFKVADKFLTLGHTRLSIIDLSSGGHQPIFSNDDRYSMVFNGEIYNYPELREELKAYDHIFHTDSDTEVLLACWTQWGVDCLPKLRGMFAFVVFDKKKKELICVRDAFGIKPFFYLYSDGDFYFASEIQALLKLWGGKTQPNWQRAYDYLVWGVHDDHESTFIDRIKILMPGHTMRLSLEKPHSMDIKRWWWPSIEERNDLSFEQATEKVRELFLQNVRLHMRSDVPIGAALSGGVDSSAIVCAMRYLEPKIPIHTFSYVARGYSVNEEPWVDFVNEQISAIPHKVVIQPKELAKDLDDLIKIQGEPFGSTSIYAQYRVFKAARQEGITVMLDGQGADELLAGYFGYPGARILSLLNEYRIKKIFSLIRYWFQNTNANSYLKFLLLAHDAIPENMQGFGRKLIGKHSQPFWINRNFLEKNNINIKYPKPIYLPSSKDNGRRLSGTLRKKICGHGLMKLLRLEDRNSMCNSIESRVPFLTTEFAETTLGLPEDFLLSSKAETKYVFRRSMKGIVPDKILDRKDKIGFNAPIFNTLKLGEDFNLDYTGHIFNKVLVKEKLKNAQNHNLVIDDQSWRIINFTKWMQIMF